MNAYTIYEFIRKVIGAITPIGCSARDKERFRNLEETFIVIRTLLNDVEEIANSPESHEGSVAKIQERAKELLSELKS